MSTASTIPADDPRMAEHADCIACEAGEGMAHYPERAS